MRGLVDGLVSSSPLGASLPAVYQEDDFAQRLTAAFDDLIAPALTTLDNLSAYLDPAVAPEDFLEWLAGWVGASMDETWDLGRRRASVAHAADLYRRRGTALGLASQVELVTGGSVEVIENGATAWSVDSGGPLPGSARPSLAIRVHVADPSAVDTIRLDRIVSSAKPAHVPHAVEIVKA